MIVAVVPYKGDEATKGRLAPAMGSDERLRLSTELLKHVLTVLRNVEVINVVATVSPEMVIGTAHIAEPGGGLNAAVQAAASWAGRRNARTLLVVPADLPFLSPADIESLLALEPPVAGGVVAPSKDGGTGGLLLKPPTIIAPAFGPSSAQNHAGALREAGCEPIFLHRSGLAIDIDVPADLDLLGDGLLDVIWGGDRKYRGQAIHSPDQAREDLARANLDE